MSNCTALSATIVATCLTACLSEAQRQYARVPITPFDNACDVQDLCRFRAELLDVVARRDRTALVTSLSSTFNEWVTAGTQRDFEAALSDPASVTWSAFERALELGGTYSDDPEPAFYAPYAYVRYPAPEPILRDANLSDGEAAVVVVASAPVHSAPRLTSPVLGTVGHELIAETGGQGATWRYPTIEGGWVQVWWHGKIGYVERQNLWSPDDPHLVLRKERGEWKISTFYDPSDRIR